jgi:undecaprenyl diphosphate synthase
LGIPALSLFAFSTENWKRPQAEIDVIMMLLRTYIKRHEHFFHENRVRFDWIGDAASLSSSTIDSLNGLKVRTAHYDGTTVVLAVNYSGQQDICQAVETIQSRGLSLSSSLVAAHLQTSRYGDVDLLIRTGREKRLSNFYLWQAAYAEISFCEKYWPDFEPCDLDEIIREYRHCERRFGAVALIS